MGVVVLVVMMMMMMVVVQVVFSDDSEGYVGLTGCIGWTLDVLLQFVGFFCCWKRPKDFITLRNCFWFCLGFVSPFNCLLFHKSCCMYLLYLVLTFYFFGIYIFTFLRFWYVMGPLTIQLIFAIHFAFFNCSWFLNSFLQMPLLRFISYELLDVSLVFSTQKYKSLVWFDCDVSLVFSIQKYKSLVWFDRVSLDVK